MSTTPTSPGWPYEFPERAIRRWAREKLVLTHRADGGVDSTFRFEGSTCGNIGFTLLYRVALAPESADRKLEALHCEPLAHDEGHKRMCTYQESAENIRDLMRDETPLHGQPLDAVLAWRPERSPAGCLCAGPSRTHKWQAVLETLHFALNRLPSPIFQ